MYISESKIFCLYASFLFFSLQQDLKKHKYLFIYVSGLSKVVSMSCLQSEPKILCLVKLIMIMERAKAWEESRRVFWWQINKINTGGISSTHSNLTTQKLIREKIISFHITNRIFIAYTQVEEDFLWSQLGIIFYQNESETICRYIWGLGL